MAQTTRVVQWKQQQVAVREIPMDGVTDELPGECDHAYALVYAGHGRTNGGGSWSLLLPAISCVKPAPGGDRRPSIVATPSSQAMTDDVPPPYVLVARTQGARITIWAFDLNGAPAAHVEFSWHCIIEGTLV
ncbi:MAG TPA: hypothetical protein VF824_14260 [Thermoanaerobaculia bacterium]|jgi:hypothetical protein